MHGAIRALAQKLGVETRVHFMGPVANADLPQLYRAADAVVMPSVSEGLANAWVEALACGTPIVISDAGGAAELVGSPVAGRIAPRTPGAIAEAVKSHRADTIYHLAALLSATAEKKPKKAYDINMGTLENVLEVACELKLAVFTPSSIGAFGPTTPRDPTPPT